MTRHDRLRVLTEEARRADGRRPLASRLRAVPAMVADTLTGRWTSGSRRGTLLALAGVAYLLSPLDLVPDLLLPIGLFDDAAIAAACAGYLLHQADRWLDQAPEPGPDGPGSVDVIDGVVVSRRDTPPGPAADTPTRPVDAAD